MALATRPKPSTQHKKRLAQHHRHNKNYLKTYWPYLPLFAILAGGAVINRDWAASSTSILASGVPPTASRIQILTGSSSGWLTTLVLALAALALLIYLLLHSLRLQRVVVKSEDYVSKHPFLDILIVLVFTSGFVLSNSPTIIR